MSPRSLPSTVRILGTVALLTASLTGCGRTPELEARPAQPAAPALTAQPAAPPPAAAEQPKPEDPGMSKELPMWQRPGWKEDRHQDNLPICVFSSEEERNKALLIEQVKKQTLQANAPVVFGTFGPRCLNEECDLRPTLQCWVDREGSTLTVSTRFHSYHKEGSTCTKQCMELDVSCQTPALEPGKYTIKHGEKTYTMDIPGLVKKPCLK